MKHDSKWLLVLLLGLVLTLMLSGVTWAEPVASGTCGDNLTWELSDDGSLTVSGTGPMAECGMNNFPWLEVAPSVNRIVIGEGITTVADYAFYWNFDRVTETVLPSTLESIGWNAFRHTGIRQVTIPASVTAIFNSAFSNCQYLESFIVDQNNSAYKAINGVLFSQDGSLLVAYPLGKSELEYSIPDGVTEIQVGAFNGSHLQKVIIPEGITQLPLQCFSQSRQLDTIVFPSTLTTLGNESLWEVGSSGEFTLPASVTVIIGHPFGSELEAVYADSTNPAYASVDGVLFSKDLKTLAVFPEVKTSSYVIPDGTEEIRSHAFAFSFKLKTLYIPDSIKSIGSWAFHQTSGLTDVYFDGTEEVWNSLTIGNNNDSLLEASIHFESKIIIDEEITNGSVTALLDNEIAETAAEGDVIILRIVPDEGYEIAVNSLSVTYTDADGQLQSEELTQGAGEEANTWSFSMPAYNVNVTAAFSLIKYTVTFVDEDGTILKAAAQYDYGTTPEAIEKPADPTKEATAQYTYTFTGWTPEITEVIGDVTYTATYSAARIPAASGTCGDNLTWELSDDGTLTVSGTGPMAECGMNNFPWLEVAPSVNRIVIGEGITTVADYAFYWNFDRVTETVLPSTLESIGWNAFRHTGIRQVTIPASVTAIFNSAFSNCQYLESFIVDQNNSAYKAINGVLFSQDGSLLVAYPLGKSELEYSIPDGVTEIQVGAFNGSHLQKVIIPEGITQLPLQCFSQSRQLDTIVFPSTLTTLGNESLWEVGSSGEFTLPASVTVIIGHPFGSELEAVYADSTNPAYASVDGVLFSKDLKTLAVFPEVKTSSYVIPDGTEEIRSHAFAFSFKLKNLYIPDSVKSIGSWAFHQTSGLTDVYFDGTEEEWNSLTIGNNNDSLLEARVHFDSKKTVIPSSVREIEAEAFRGSGVKVVVIPESIQTIAKRAFADCEDLTLVELGSESVSIDPTAFENSPNALLIYPSGRTVTAAEIS